MKASVLDLENLIQGFKLSCQTEGLSPKTTEWYISFVTRFVRFLQSRDFPTNLENIRKAHIRDFIRYLQVEARTPYSDKHSPPLFLPRESLNAVCSALRNLPLYLCSTSFGVGVEDPTPLLPILFYACLAYQYHTFDTVTFTLF